MHRATDRAAGTPEVHVAAGHEADAQGSTHAGKHATRTRGRHLHTDGPGRLSTAANADIWGNALDIDVN